MAIVIMLGVILWVKRKTDDPKSTVIDDSLENWMRL